jgi:hypothetical protein
MRTETSFPLCPRYCPGLCRVAVGLQAIPLLGHSGASEHSSLPVRTMKALIGPPIEHMAALDQIMEWPHAAPPRAIRIFFCNPPSWAGWVQALAVQG